MSIRVLFANEMKFNTTNIPMKADSIIRVFTPYLPVLLTNAANTLLRKIKAIRPISTTPNIINTAPYNRIEVTKVVSASPINSAITPAKTTGLLKEPIVFKDGSRKLNRVRDPAVCPVLVRSSSDDELVSWDACSEVLVFEGDALRRRLLQSRG